MITPAEQEAIKRHYDEVFLACANHTDAEVEVASKLCPVCLYNRIAGARAALVDAKKEMGGLARISFQKHIDAAMQILSET